MDIAGMTIGVVFPVSMFEKGITCFACARMAKTFVSDLQLFMVHLKVLHLRLTRWGEAVDLNNIPKDNNAANNKPLAIEMKVLRSVFSSRAKNASRLP